MRAFHGTGFMATTDVTTNVTARNGRISGWERAADRFNAILVKETRQALKSRQFILTFLLMLLAAWSVSVIGTAMNGAEVEYGNAGRSFFVGFYSVLALATIIVVPFGAYRSLLAERDQNTYDLLSITTLSPGKIVRGKLASAILQLFIFYSAITPFMAFASLLNGFDAPTAAYVLLVSLLCSVLLCMTALMFATFSKQRVWQGFNSLGVLGGLAWAFFASMAIVGSSVQFNWIPFDEEEFWWANGAALLIGLSYFVMFHQITTAQMTFESGNRSTGIRIAATGQFWLVWAMILFLFVWTWALFPIAGPPTFENEALLAIGMACSIHWAVFGLFAVTEPESLSRRVHRDLPRRKWLRAVTIPFHPGGARGFLWVTLHTFLYWALCVVFWCGFNVSPGAAPGGVTGSSYWSLAWTNLWNRLPAELLQSPSSWVSELQALTGMCCYLIIILGGISWVGRALRRIAPELAPAHIRVLAIIALTLSSMVPLIFRSLRFITGRQFTLMDMLNPLDTLFQMGNTSTNAEPVLVILIIAAILTMLINVPGILVAVKESLRENRPATPAAVSAPAPVLAAASATES